jgi:hypothetical protein
MVAVVTVTVEDVFEIDVMVRTASVSVNSTGGQVSFCFTTMSGNGSPGNQVEVVDGHGGEAVG